ncbi:hypothetical protein OAK92_01725 [Crocinitomicaceae bacterium]|nr:hypothetical protein [Crocinitomicaceae bacterium]
MDKVKILKAKTFVKVEWGSDAERVEYLPTLDMRFKDFDFALMHCQDDCVCEDEIPTDCDFYFKLISQKNAEYLGKCHTDQLDTLGFTNPSFFTFSPPDGVYVLTSYCPSSLDDGELYGDNLIHTSDGVVEIEQDEFLVNKSGHIASATPEEVLSIFSRRKVNISPSYKELRLSNSRTRPARAAVGTLIYNQNTGQLEFKGKNGWERIITKDIK